MSKKKPTDKQIHEALEANNWCQTDAAKHLGCSRARVYRYIKRKSAQINKSDFGVIEKPNEVVLTYQGEEWFEPSQILRDSGYDLKIWRVESTQIRGWEVTGKLNRGQEVAEINGREVLRWLPQELWKSKNRYIAIRLVRRAPKIVQDGIKLLLEGVKAIPPVTSPPPSNKDPHQLEISLYDVHYGKHCWRHQTGEDFDLKICDLDFRYGISDLLEKSSRHPIDRIVFPVGHDFFNVNNWSGTTAAGTEVESVDDRFPKVFRRGAESLEWGIRECLKVAPVEILWVPGNHDPETSYYLCEWMEARFRENKHVEIDVSAKERKYRTYGVNLFGYIHGDPTKQPKDDQLPLLMAVEHPDWNNNTTQWRQWRMGHYHKKSLKKYVTISDVWNGIEVVRMPSLTATDAYHFTHGWVKNHRTSEGWLYHKRDGYAGHVSSTALSGR